MSNTKYEDQIYDGRTVIIKTLNANDPNLSDPKDFDLYFSSSLSTFAYRNSNGEWIECKDQYPKGIGPVCVRIIQALMLNPGRNLNPQQIAKLSNRDAVAENGNLAARICKIRKLIGYGFLETSTIDGYHVRWPKPQRWLWREIIEQED